MGPLELDGGRRILGSMTGRRRRPRLAGEATRAGAMTEEAWTVWRLMFGVLIRSAPERTRSLAQRNLTPNDSRALFSLDVREGRTMRALASEWQCDPSNATWVVDRLERLGLAERRTVAEDRRVKLVVLTARGQATRRALLAEFHRPPKEFAALDREDLESLRRVLAKLSPGLEGERSPRGSERLAGSGPGAAGGSRACGAEAMTSAAPQQKGARKNTLDVRCSAAVDKQSPSPAESRVSLPARLSSAGAPGRVQRGQRHPGAKNPGAEAGQRPRDSRPPGTRPRGAGQEDSQGGAQTKSAAHAIHRR